MLVNIPKTVFTSYTESLINNRAIYLEQFEDESGFVFNAENPSGVKYLTKETFKIYNSLLNEYGYTPQIDANESALFSDLVKHGIATSVDPIKPQQKVVRRSFDVWFHISNACNLACRYCYIPKLNKAVDLKLMNKHFMSESTMETATKSLFEFCVENKFNHLQIKFAGGEPTLNMDGINQCCKIAMEMSKEYDIKVSFIILTNGVFINRKIITTIHKYNFGVCISLDGDRDRHNEMRFITRKSRTDNSDDHVKKQGSWDIIDNTIDSLISTGIRPFILCTVTASNYMHLHEFVKYTISKKIGFRFSLVRDGVAYKINNLGDEILTALIKIYEWLSYNMPVDMPIERFARFAEWNLYVKKQAVCGTCKNTVSIDQEGKVASCQMRIDKPFGNVNNERLTDIFNNIQKSEDNKYLFNPNLKSGDCSICYWKYTCAGGCPEHTRIAKGTANSPSPWCNIYQNLLPHYCKAIARQIKRSVECS